MRRDIISHVAAPIGRLLLSSIFIMSGVNKLMAWGETAAWMEKEGMVFVPFFLAAAAAVEILGGLSILTGFGARLGALALFAFLIPTTLIFHDFWTYSGEEFQTQMINFMKNLAIMGGLLVVAGLGAGPFSVDAILRRRIPAASPGQWSTSARGI